MPNFIKNGLMSAYNFFSGIGHWNDYKESLIDDMSNYPAFKPGGVVVFGAGEVSGAVARAAAKLAIDGKVSVDTPFYFTGGISPLEKAAKNGTQDLVAQLTDAGIPPPQTGEKEGSYMRRVFFAELAKHKLTAPPSHAEDRSTNTQQNVDNAVAMGAGRHESLTLVALPYHTRRAIGTWRRQTRNQDVVLMPHMAWPEDLGITATTWQNSRLAKFFLIQEGKKMPDYIKRGYCDFVDVKIEKYKSLALAQRQTQRNNPQHTL